MTNNDLIIRMARAMHDGPLGADDHVFDATTAQGNWCMDMARAALDAIDLSELTPTPEQIAAETILKEARKSLNERYAAILKDETTQEPDTGELNVSDETLRALEEIEDMLRVLGMGDCE